MGPRIISGGVSVAAVLALAAVGADPAASTSPGAVERDRGGRHAGHPRPRPAGYVDQAGPAAIDLPQTTIAADPIGDGRVGRHPGEQPHQAGRSGTAPSVSNPAIVSSPGSWSIERNIDRMVHFFALPSSPTADQYLACAGSGNTSTRGAGAAGQQFTCYRVDRSANTQTVVPLPDDWFCSAAVHDENGDVVSAGGTRVYPAANGAVAKTWGGLATTYRYQTTTGAVTRLGDMAVPRWYPNLAKNQNDDIVVQGGQDDGRQQASWEIMRRGTTTWETLPFRKAMNSYADLQLIAPDTFAFTGATSAPKSSPPFILDLGTSEMTSTPGLRDVGSRRASSGLLAFPAQAQKVLVVGGGNLANTGATADMDLIDYSQWPAVVPSFTPRSPLPAPMLFVQMVNLPNGQIFATGGSSAWRTGDVLWAGFYDLASDSWQLVAPPTVGRDYHSVIWVNTDGSVSIAGGNPSEKVFHSEVETYRPWYMDLPRPWINPSSLPAIAPGETLPRLAKGSTYTISGTLPSGSQVGSFTLDAARAATHVSSDPDQAMFDVPWRYGWFGSVSITIPDTPLLTPGAYRLSGVTSNGVPSPGVWVKVVE